ncbi:MAG TPA: hypothetical protein PLJ38_05850 [bacterium]|nr:hypothetical protein [bacterium]
MKGYIKEQILLQASKQASKQASNYHIKSYNLINNSNKKAEIYFCECAQKYISAFLFLLGFFIL